MNCPYCQTKIKNQNEAVTCPLCGTPHHTDCWTENGGCTTYGCRENPNFKNNAIEVGDLTINQVQQLQNIQPSVDSNSETIINTSFDNENSFENEFKRRYKENLSARRKQNAFVVSSILILFAFIMILLFSVFSKLNGIVNSEDYKIKEFIYNWKSAWESKNIEKLKNFYDEDYVFIDKDKSTANLNDRTKRLSQSFRNSKKINITFSDIKIKIDSTERNYANVTFIQEYKSDKIKETGKKTLRLYRAEKSSFEWKIFREFYE